MCRKSLLVALLLVLWHAFPTFADTVQFIPGGAQFTDPGSGLSISPYLATITGPFGNTTTQDVFCVDFSSFVSNNSSWSAQVTILGNSANDYSNTRLDNGQSYQEMAFLIEQEVSALAELNANPSDIAAEIAAAADQLAIWCVSVLSSTNTCATVPDPYNSNTSLISSAQMAVVGGFNVSGWEILTPEQGQTGQEVILVTPEPASSVLLATGLLLVGIFTWYRRCFPVPAC
jgi:hypothetical protein